MVKSERQLVDLTIGLGAERSEQTKGVRIVQLVVSFDARQSFRSTKDVAIAAFRFDSIAGFQRSARRSFYPTSNRAIIDFDVDFDSITDFSTDNAIAIFGLNSIADFSTDDAIGIFGLNRIADFQRGDHL